MLSLGSIVGSKLAKVFIPSLCKALRTSKRSVGVAAPLSHSLLFCSSKNVKVAPSAM